MDARTLVFISSQMFCHQLQALASRCSPLGENLVQNQTFWVHIASSGSTGLLLKCFVKWKTNQYIMGQSWILHFWPISAPYPADRFIFGSVIGYLVFLSNVSRMWKDTRLRDCLSRENYFPTTWPATRTQTEEKCRTWACRGSRWDEPWKIQRKARNYSITKCPGLHLL